MTKSAKIHRRNKSTKRIKNKNYERFLTKNKKR